MYKVFFNDRTIYLDDSLPEMSKVGNDYVCAFENVTDLKPQVKQFLDPEKSGNLYIFHDNQEELFRTFTMCFRLVEAGGGLVRNPSGEVLFIFRRGKWDLPKGKAESGETLSGTALREVEEETGLSGIETGDLLTTTHHIYLENNKLILKKTDWYSMSYKGKGSPVPATEEQIIEARWFDPSELQEVYANTYLSIIDVIEKAKALDLI